GYPSGRVRPPRFHHQIVGPRPRSRRVPDEGRGRPHHLCRQGDCPTQPGPLLLPVAPAQGSEDPRAGIAYRRLRGDSHRYGERVADPR
ncbi:MAG: Excinuclease ABC subunit C, partial [uncultured Thermomicrobiales bacterium]